MKIPQKLRPGPSAKTPRNAGSRPAAQFSSEVSQ